MLRDKFKLAPHRKKKLNLCFFMDVELSISYVNLVANKLKNIRFPAIEIL